MSDLLNSPNNLSPEHSQKLTPETDSPAVNNQSAMASSNLSSAVEDLNNSLDDFEMLEGLAVIDNSPEEMSSEEEASFEVIADYIEAEIAIEAANSAESCDHGHGEIADDEVFIEELEAGADEAIAPESDQASGYIETAEVEGVAEIDMAPELTSPGESEEAIVQEDVAEGEASHLEMSGADIADEEMTDSFDASIEVVDVEILESQEQEKSYEVHQDGTLTYFQYFLDEEESAFGPGYGDWRSEANSSPRSFVSATAVGVGALAAVFGAGLLMAEATNQKSISDSDSDGFESQTKAEAERKASESANLAKASSPEAGTPDWSATQKALAVSQGSANANPALGSTSEKLEPKPSPATSSATGKLAPLTQAWGAPVPLPPATLPVAPPPSVAALPIVPPPAAATASLPTPTTVPANLSALQPIPSYQVVQPTSRITDEASTVARLPNPPAVETLRPDEQQLQARMDALRDRMSSPIDSATVPVATDGSLAGGTDVRWVGNVPTQVNVPVGDIPVGNVPGGNGGTTIDTAFESRELPSLADSPYGSETTVTSSPAALPPDIATSGDSLSADSITAAPQAYPLDLEPIVVPAQARTLDEQVVPPVAGLVPTRLTPVESEPSQLPSQASAPSAEDREPASNPTIQASSVRSQDDASPIATVQGEDFQSSLKQSAFDITPGAIALEVIPPKLPAPSLTTSALAVSPAPEQAESANVSDRPEQVTSFKNAASRTVASRTKASKSGEPNSALNKSRDVNSLLELASRQSAHPLALSRNTAQAALENAEQLDQFRVLPLTVQEYQRLWQESNELETFAPIHGFVDYSQNVIAVLIAQASNREASALKLETAERIAEATTQS